jgi:pantetheine-phosphate adenylyltransferase
MNKKIAVFPGSFDPIPKGHESIITRALPLFDEIIVAVGVNSQKKYLFSLAQRLTWIKETFAEYPSVRVENYTGLTIDFCRQSNAKYILRGLRNATDFEFEKGIGQVNKALYPEIENVFLLSLPEFIIINSTIVRDIIRNNGDVSRFVPDKIKIDAQTL